MVFETGLRPATYLDRVHVDLTRMIPADTVTACPYKAPPAATGRADALRHQSDLAWLRLPTRQLLPVAGLVCFYNSGGPLPGRRAAPPADQAAAIALSLVLLAVSLAVPGGLRDRWGGGGAYGRRAGIPGARSGRR